MHCKVESSCRTLNNHEDETCFPGEREQGGGGGLKNTWQLLLPTKPFTKIIFILMQYIIITLFETLDHLKPESDKKDAGEGDGRAELIVGNHHLPARIFIGCHPGGSHGHCLNQNTFKTLFPWHTRFSAKAFKLSNEIGGLSARSARRTKSTLGSIAAAYILVISKLHCH